MTDNGTRPLLTIELDRTKCCGYTLCAVEGPDVYSIDPQGFAIVPESVPAELEEQAIRGAEACPALAIILSRAGEPVVLSV